MDQTSQINLPISGIIDIREVHLMKRRSFPDSSVSRFTFHLSPATETGPERIAKRNGFTALRAGGYHIDGTLGDLFKVLEIALGFHRELFVRGRAGGST